MTEQYKIRIEKNNKHLFDNSELNVYNKEILNLSVGAPGTDLLLKCCEIFKKATVHRLDIESKTDSYLFQYGPEVGDVEARTELAKFLTLSYNSKVSKEDLIVTTGATQGVHLIVSTLVDMKGVIFVDEVTYMIALNVFQQFTSMQIIPVKLNSSGVNIANLTDLLEKYYFKSNSKMFWGMYYTIPTFHNPTGILFSDEICTQLIKLSRKFDILITCDDVYNLLYYSLPVSPKRLYSYDIMDNGFKGNIISNGTFSKLIGPGIRLGWMECPPRIIEVFRNSGVLKSGGCTNNYTAGILTSLLQLGLAQSHIEMVRSYYKERMFTVCNVLKKELPSTCRFKEPLGGYFIWIKLPDGSCADKFNKFCLEKYKIFCIVGTKFSKEGTFQNYLRLSIAFHAKEMLEIAAKKLCKAAKEFLE